MADQSFLDQAQPEYPIAVERIWGGGEMEPVSGPQRSSTFLHSSDALALLRDLEELLVELRSVGAASFRSRLDIEAELSQIRHDLERLGFPLQSRLRLRSPW
jgi:hypothetical protein